MSSTAEPEYLGPAHAPSGPRRSSPRVGLLVAVVVAVVAVVGAGAYGLLQFLGGGDSPAAAVPAGAIGYVSLDLDPSASQKIEAIKIMRKFPSLRKQLKIGSRDDVRRRIFEQIQEQGDCKRLDYDSDVKPWLGDRVALAAVPGAGHRVMPLVALQVTDEDKAKAGFRKLDACDRSDDDPAVAFSGDYALLAEKQSDADRMAKAAGAHALQDDPDFSAWMDRLGDSGIVTMYAAKDAGDVAIAAARRQSGGELTGSSGTKQLQTMLKNFDGAAGVVRFKDGAVEADLQSKGLSGVTTTSGTRGSDAGSLPASTAAVLSLSLPDGWIDRYVDQLRSAMGTDAFDGMMTEAEQHTGLQLPEDLRTLLGRGLSVSLDSSADFSSLQQQPDLSRLPVGIRVSGDQDKITPIIDKLKASAGPGADMVKVKAGGGAVAVGPDEDYLDSLLGNGSLGSSRSFRSAVPEADKASFVLFVNFDAGSWATRLADLLSAPGLSASDPSADGSEAKADLAPLDALGVSGWVGDDKVQHALVRLSTD